MNCRTAASVMSNGRTQSLHRISYTSSDLGRPALREETEVVEGKERMSTEERGVVAGGVPVI